MKGKMKCPICHGKGKITENAEEYMFETRDPETNTCLICMGTGLVGVRKVLPDGTPAKDVKNTEDTKGTEKRLDSGVKAAPFPKTPQRSGASCKKGRTQSPAPLSGSLDEELNELKQLAAALPLQNFVIIKAAYFEISGPKTTAAEAVASILTKLKSGE